MELYFRLFELLDIDEARARGVIAKLAKQTGLSRGKLSDLLHNKTKSVNLQTLSKICDYVVEAGVATEADVPGALFGRRPNRFWSLVAERRKIEFCMGTRQDPNWYDELVMAADAELQAQLLYGISGTSGLGWHGGTSSVGHGQLLDPRLVAAPTVDSPNEKAIRDVARTIYREFIRERSDKALILLGSIKSNPVVELVVSRCFKNAQAFTSQDQIATATQRSCPFLYLYRDHDPHPTSVCGGVQLSSSERGDGPGIYYEAADGTWDRCGWDKQSDAALVFYRLHKSCGQLEMVLGGFSARAKRCLANFLSTNEGQKLWPPVYSDGELDVGLFILQFAFRGREDRTRYRQERPLSTNVIPIDGETLARRIRRNQTKSSQPPKPSTVKARGKPR